MRVVVAGLFLLSVVYAQASYTWVGGDSCNTGNVWSYSSNSSCWSPPGLPGTYDAITFPAGSVTTLTGSSSCCIYSSNWFSSYLPYGYVMRATFSEVLVEGTLFINDFAQISFTKSFNIAPSGTVQIQGNLGIIDGPGTLIVDGNLTILQGALSGTGSTVINSGALFNISSMPYPNQMDPYNITEVYIMRDMDIFGNVSMVPISSKFPKKLSNPNHNFSLLFFLFSCSLGILVGKQIYYHHNSFWWFFESSWTFLEIL